jgi:5'(3')-deoxyribonucleotidase
MITIAVDVDDTVCNLVDEWLRLYNLEYDDNLKKENITDWDIGSFTKAGKDFYKYINFDIYDNCKTIFGAKSGIKYLRSLGHRIIFVTAYNYGNSKLNWLLKHKFIETDKDFVVARDKSLIKADMLIDDNYENVKKFDNTNSIGILFQAPWNKKFEYNYRVKNWKELITFCKQALFLEKEDKN